MSVFIIPPAIPMKITNMRHPIRNEVIREYSRVTFSPFSFFSLISLKLCKAYRQIVRIYYYPRLREESWCFSRSVDRD